MSIICLVGIHSRVPADHENPFILNHYRCRRCPGIWALVTVGSSGGWVRMR